MNNTSQKHHFIPIFYQKGFRSDQDELFAYKKDRGGIKIRSPSQIMYEKNLHTFQHKGEESMIEDFYSKLEGWFSEYSKIMENIDNPNLIGELMKDGNFQRLAKLMVSIQFWRTPCRTQQAIIYAEKLVNLYDKADDETKTFLYHNRDLVEYHSKRAVRYHKKRAKKNDSLKLIQFFLLPLLSFDISCKVKNFKLFQANEHKKFITSDRPVIY
ncbi:MAG: DUF4238 domain-containing protein [Mariprofundaceae bacterium]|nr:DUF4238 domain-containing protein [Mariprofundaceae bacterium]